MEKDRYDSLEQLLAERLGEFREEPSEGLFDRIEATLLAAESVPPAVAPKRSLWQRPIVRYTLAMAVAASLFFGVTLFVEHSAPRAEIVALEKAVLAEVQTTPIEEVVPQQDASAMVAVAAAPRLKARVAESVTKDIEDSHPTELVVTNEISTSQSVEKGTDKPSKATPSTTTTRSRKRQQNHKSDEEIEAYWRAILGFDEEPRRLSLAHPAELSLYAANIGFNQGDMILQNLTNGAMVVNEHSVLNGDAGLTGPNVFRAPQMSNQLKHYMPVSVGLTASYALADWMALEVGVVYTHLHSRSDNEGQMSTYACKRDMHYIGVPIGTSFRFANWDRVGLYGKLGATFEHCMKATDTYYTNGKQEGNRGLDTPGLQLSLDAAAGINYMLWGGVGLYGEAGISYWNSLQPHPENYRTENPLSLMCRVGLRFTFR